MRAIKRFLKNWLPPALINIHRSWSTDAIRYTGRYSSWESASKNSTGYDADSILERVCVASEKVKAGEVAYERDSVLFDKVEHSFPLLAVLMKIALESQGRLTVLDFGGALGSSYFQCKHFLPDDIDLKWCVVEQEKFVIRGRNAFESDELKFFFSIQESAAQYAPDIVLFASVLQYLEHVDQVIDDAIDVQTKYIVIDRTPFVEHDSDWLCVQHVPASIYDASYPCSLLSDSRLKLRLKDRFELLAEFDALGGKEHVQYSFKNIPFEYKGMIWQRH